MGKITNISCVAVKRNKIYYNGKKIEKWWGRTLYYLNPITKELYYRNFSLFGLIFQAFNYKKQYNKYDLSNWLKSKNVKVQGTAKGKSFKT